METLTLFDISDITPTQANLPYLLPNFGKDKNLEDVITETQFWNVLADLYKRQMKHTNLSLQQLPGKINNDIITEIEYVILYSEFGEKRQI